ncbi:MAG: amino acid ABC transporter permease [marine bacterium B5-7]|nr:MAG: amino acid ABC transporter permease [marine bacterium B5-7]
MAEVQSNVPPKKGGFSLSDTKTRGLIYQALTIAMVVYGIWWIIDNAANNMAAQNIKFGFGFLTTQSGFGIIQSLIDYNESSSYGRVFFVGLLNTLIVALIGCILTTIIGFIVGVGRLSKNWLINKISTIYVETLRNIPLLLQIFFWYNAVLKPLPGPRDVHDKGDQLWFSLSNNGLMIPKPIPEGGFWIVFTIFVLGIIGAIVIKKWAFNRQMATGQQFKTIWTTLGLIIVLPLLAFVVMGSPLHFQPGEMGTFRPNAGFGLNVIPEFIALLLALVAYTSAFVAEIVRAGIQSVSHGQTEASYALGLRPGPTLKLIIIPQAMRVIVPPLTSQYLNLTKNSSLAVAIAYPDLVAVFTGTVLNQTGKAVEIIMMTMLVYLSISLVTSTFMNWYNDRVKLVER